MRVREAVLAHVVLEFTRHLGREPVQLVRVLSPPLPHILHAPKLQPLFFFLVFVVVTVIVIVVIVIFVIVFVLAIHTI